MRIALEEVAQARAVRSGRRPVQPVPERPEEGPLGIVPDTNVLASTL